MIIQENKRWRYVPAMRWLHTLSLHIKKQRRYDNQGNIRDANRAGSRTAEKGVLQDVATTGEVAEIARPAHRNAGRTQQQNQ